ncbi:MAG: hypothetical protein IJU55_00045 [Selenomonadaceae bacterium]|nr:hypothetical protein [Selenomonadaceae bacterium]
MSMVIQHNAQAQLALGELNKNVTKVGKLLAKVSSGQKINSAQDDASSYVISEKMREQIRTLLQDDQNVQNGSSLFKIAEGGISNIVEELRNLKELAINSANDTNTDMDRLTIQKEFDQKKANINDIATTTNYNGKILLDGRYGRKLEDVYSKIWVTDYGTPGATTPINLTDNFYARTGTTEIEDSDFDSIAGSYYRITDGKMGSGASPHRPVTDVFIDSEAPRYYYGTISEYTSSGTSVTRPTVAEAYIDFTDPTLIYRTEKYGVANVLDGQGFSIHCGTCDQYVNVVFDGTKTTSSWNNGSYTNVQYSIGIKGAKNIFDLPRVIFEGFANARGEQIVNNTVNIETKRHTITMIKDTTRSGWVDQNTGERYYSYYIRKEGFPLQFNGEGIIDLNTNKLIPNITTGHWEIHFDKEITELKDPLIIHHGTKANQHTKFYINDMHTKSLGTGTLFVNDDSLTDYEQIMRQEDKDRYEALSYDEKLQNAWIETLKSAQNKNLDDISVTTKHNANIAIRVLDGAIDYALNEATQIGSYLQRLDYTDSNLVVMNENVQAAESSIRDADMAKEMTEYTKFNILTQSAQAMLAQANQNSSGVLSLLQ